MKYELVLEGNLYYNKQLIKGCIGIEDGQIKAVKKILKGETHLDVGDKLVLPTAIDPHVHFRDPGFPDKEDFSTGSLSAVFGGVTTVLDMPNTRPAVITAGRLKDKFEAIKGRSHVDYGLFCGLGPRTVIEKAVPLASGFKIYLGETTGDMRTDDDDLLKRSLAEMAKHPLPVTIHCEDKACLPDLPRSQKAPKDPIDHDRLRPEALEGATVKKVSSLKEAKEAKVHIAHVSSIQSLEAKAKSFTCEVTPHHMFLAADRSLKAYGKMNPPLRNADTASNLRTALNNGTIDIVASDHAPHTREEKEAPFVNAPAGVPGVETMVPLLLKSLKGQGISLGRLVDAITFRSSQIFGLEGKGAIAKGMDADIMTVDLREEVKVKGDRLHSKVSWSPFEGQPVIFPKNVFVRGMQVIHDWEFVGDKGWGRPVKEGVPGRSHKG